MLFYGQQVYESSMSEEDPFFTVKEDIENSLLHAQELYNHHQDLSKSDTATNQETEWLKTELRNSLRSVEWDLEDLEETLSILTKNPGKFSLGKTDLVERKRFIDDSRNLIADIRDKMSSSDSRFKDKNTLLKNGMGLNDSSSGGGGGGGGGGNAQYKYSRLLENENSSSGLPPSSSSTTSHALPRGHPDRFVEDTFEQQQLIMDAQDETMEDIGSSAGVLRDMSRRIGGELDEQALMLEDMGQAMDRTDSKMENVMKKVAKVTHMSNDKRQCYAIIVLCFVLFIVVLLLIEL